MALPAPITWLARILLVALLLLITWASLRPPPPMVGPNGADKVVHFLAYAAVAALALGSGMRAWTAVALAVLWGAGVEVAQGLGANGRTPSVADGVANTLGALAAVAAWSVVGRVIRARSKKMRAP